MYLSECAIPSRSPLHIGSNGPSWTRPRPITGLSTPGNATKTPGMSAIRRAGAVFVRGYGWTLALSKKCLPHSALRILSTEASAVVRDAAPLAAALGVAVGAVAPGRDAALGEDASVDTLGGHGVGESHGDEAENQSRKKLHFGG